MKISNISTGRKLIYKTFGDLKPGDKMYFLTTGDISIDDITCTVKGLVGKCKSKVNGYSDLNPEEKVETLCDIVLKIDTQFGDVTCYLPSGATYFVCGKIVLATSQELMFQVIKQYNIESYIK